MNSAVHGGEERIQRLREETVVEGQGLGSEKIRNVRGEERKEMFSSKGITPESEDDSAWWRIPGYKSHA